MSNGEKRGGLWIDPRTKILLLLLCVLSATMAPSLLYEMLIVALVACFGIVCGKVRYSIIGVIVYGGFYLLTQAVLQMPSGNVQVMLIAFLGLVHKVYPCGILSGIIISTTKVGGISLCHERSHISQKIVIPLRSCCAMYLQFGRTGILSKTLCGCGMYHLISKILYYIRL